MVGCGSLDKSPCPAMVGYMSTCFKIGQKTHECGDGHTQNQFLRNSLICSLFNGNNNKDTTLCMGFGDEVSTLISIQCVSLLFENVFFMLEH